MPSVYILRCADGTFYVGHTDDVVSRREKAHNDGFGSRYTAARRPVQVVYSEVCTSLQAAVSRERQLKRWSAKKNAALAVGNVASLKRLSKRQTR
jgi:predicted GIY-YIG superfamily endonuclease